jgi:hypothetical protein
LFQQRDLGLRRKEAIASAAPIVIASAFILCAMLFPWLISSQIVAS